MPVPQYTLIVVTIRTGQGGTNIVELSGDGKSLGSWTSGEVAVNDNRPKVGPGS